MKKIFFLICILLSVSLVNAYQTSLSSFDFNSIQLTGEKQTACNTFNANFADLNEEGSPILSLQARFDGIQSDNSYVSIQVNDSEPQVLWPEFFSCKTSCWARVFLPELQKTNSTIKLCLATGGKTQSAELLNSSFIGIYNTPVISVKTTAPQEIYLGQRARMSIVITNSGTKSAEVFSQFVSQDIRSILEITSFDIIEGDSSITTVVEPNETKEFVYYVKPNKTGTYNLPYAIVSFQNIFAEKQSLVSNHPQMKVTNPEQISTTITATELQKNKIKITAMITNNWNKQFTGTIAFKPTDLLTTQTTILSMEPNTEREIIAYTDVLLPGQYDFVATITDSNKAYYSNTINYSISKEEVPFFLVFAIVAVLFAVIIFFGIYNSKVKK